MGRLLIDHMKTLSDTLFILLTMGLATLVVIGARHALGGAAARNTALALGSWLTLVAVLAATGFYADTTAIPPRLVFMIAPVIIVLVVAAISATVSVAADATSQTWLIGLQGFRVVVELILWMLHRQGIVPVQMTVEGLNVDIVVGLAALVLLVPMLRGWQPKRGVILAFNVAGLIIVTNIVVVGILSAPSPVRLFMNEPANTIVATFPYCWLPGIVVPIAYILHIMSLRKGHGGMPS